MLDAERGTANAGLKIRKCFYSFFFKLNRFGFFGFKLIKPKPNRTKN